MYGTTPAFLERVGADSLADLPALGDFVPGADVVEQLERGLRPDSPTLTERLEQLEATNGTRDGSTKAPGPLDAAGDGPVAPIDLDRALGVDDDLDGPLDRDPVASPGDDDPAPASGDDGAAATDDGR
jgi:hypothetical protein